MANDQQCCEVPLTEQLRSVPIDYRTCVAIQWAEDGTETGHRFIPVGVMMHRAADEIDRLSALPDRANAAPNAGRGEGEVERYTDSGGRKRMIEFPDGEYVKWHDVGRYIDTLRQRLAEMTAMHAKLAWCLEEGRKDWLRERDRAAKAEALLAGAIELLKWCDGCDLHYSLLTAAGHTGDDRDDSVSDYVRKFLAEHGALDQRLDK